MKFMKFGFCWFSLNTMLQKKGLYNCHLYKELFKQTLWNATSN